RTHGASGQPYELGVASGARISLKLCQRALANTFETARDRLRAPDHETTGVCLADEGVVFQTERGFVDKKSRALQSYDPRTQGRMLTARVDHSPLAWRYLRFRGAWLRRPCDFVEPAGRSFVSLAQKVATCSAAGRQTRDLDDYAVVSPVQKIA